MLLLRNKQNEMLTGKQGFGPLEKKYLLILKTKIATN